MSLVHDAFVYDSDDVFVAEMGRHLDAGLRAGATAVAITTQHNLGLLREALATDEDRIVYIDRDDWYRHPPHVIAGFDRVLRLADAAGSSSVCAIGEVRFGATPREWDRWTAYEATIDRALAGRDLQVVCPYDARVLPAQVLAAAGRTHAHVVGDGRRESPAHEAPERVVRAHTPQPEPLPQLRTLRPPAHARDLREQLRRELAAGGVPDAAAGDMLLAAGEVFSNAQRHGGGASSLRVGRVGTHVVCEIADAGAGLDDPLAGYVPPAPAADGGAGLWVARQATSAVELLRTEGGGLTVRLWS